MSKIIINGTIHSENITIGDNNTVNIGGDNLHQKLLSEIQSIYKDIGENNATLNDIVLALDESLKANNPRKFINIVRESKNFLLQFAANFSAISLDHLIHI